MRVLVTGGSGFLGSHIADELISRGHEVVVLDTSDSTLPGREVVVGDVRDGDVLANAIAGCGAVFHCAAVADLQEARLNARQALDVNVMGTLTALEAAAAAGVQRFMLASSVYVFSKSGSVYRTSKRAAEGLVEDLSPDLGLESTILRFGSLYGPRADANNAILRIVRQAVDEGRIDFWGDGTEVREYIHISDAATLAVNALDPRFAGEALHITGRERVSTTELLEMINEMMGGGLTVTMNDVPFEGRYRLTPFTFESGSGRRFVGDTYVDLGLGLLGEIRALSEVRDAEWRAT